MPQDNPKEKTGGLAYDLILKPAQAESPRPPSPPKERPLSQEIIEKKLKEAEERRLSMEQSKLESAKKSTTRREEAVQKIQELNTSFSKEAEQKLTQKLETVQEKKNAQIQALQDRLRDHEKHVEEVRSKKVDRSTSQEDAVAQ